MRSVEITQTAAQSFSALVKELAERAGYDLSPYGTDKMRLATDSGMSRSAVDRMLRGQTLPMPDKYEALARALRTDVRHLLVEGRVLSASSWPEVANGALPSQPEQLTPDAAADSWGITDPLIRSMLIANINHAIRLQAEAARQAGGDTAARG